MEKISLKPTAKEIDFRHAEPNTHHEIFGYAPHDERERHLGHLYIIGQIKYGEENMAYVLNLISSLAKREYYSENDSPPEDPRQALDMALKKLNGVLEDFFKNKDFRLDIGLVAIGSGSIYIAKLGKFKVFLARGHELIDILNNVVLFQKEHLEEKRFINIISGKIQEGDRIFAFYPTRHLTLKEKEIKTTLLNNGQEEFLAELTSLGQKSQNFQACGFHLEIKKVREETIPIRSAYEKSRLLLADFEKEKPSPKPSYRDKEITPEKESKTAKSRKNTAENTQTILAANTRENDEPKPPTNLPVETTAISEEKIKVNAEEETETPLTPPSKAISAEISLIRRGNIFSKMVKNLPWHPGFSHKQSRGFLILILAALLVGGGFFVVQKYWLGQKSRFTSLLKSTEENLRLAEAQIAKNDQGAARQSLKASLGSLDAIEDPNVKISEAKDKIISALDRIDLVSASRPKIFFDASGNIPSAVTHVWALNASTVAVLGKDSKIYEISNNSFSEIGTLSAINTLYTFQETGRLAIFNGLDQLAVWEIESDRSSNYRLPDSTPVLNAAIYESNLYLLGENSIYKYADALTGKTKTKQTWLGGLSEPNPLALAADGNVYVLTADGLIVKYFRGTESGRFDLKIRPSAKVTLSAPKESPYLFLADYLEKKIWTFDRQDGSLAATYKFAHLPEIKNMTIAANFAFVLDSEDKIWKIDF